MSSRPLGWHKRTSLTPEEAEARRLRNCEKANRHNQRKRDGQMEAQRKEEDEDRLDREHAEKEQKRLADAARARKQKKRERETDRAIQVAELVDEFDDALADAEVAVQRSEVLEYSQDIVASYSALVRTPQRAGLVQQRMAATAQTKKIEGKVVLIDAVEQTAKRLKETRELLPSSELAHAVASSSGQPPSYDTAVEPVHLLVKTLPSTEAEYNYEPEQNERTAQVVERVEGEEEVSDYVSDSERDDTLESYEGQPDTEMQQ